MTYWSGTLYGFTENGELFEIDISTDTLRTRPLNFPEAPGNLSFWGAGSTTIAPIIL
jgi:hypothetical protein